MKHNSLFKLKLTSKAINYDYTDSFVIRANDERGARIIASQESGDEGAESWLDPRFSTCSLLSQHGPDGVVISSFNAG